MAEGVRVAPRGAGVGAAEEKTLLLLCGPVADEQAGAGEVEGGPERGALVYGDTDGDRPGRGRPHCPWQPGNGGGGQLGVPRADLADGEGLPRATRTARRYEVGCGARPLRYGAVTSGGHGAGLGRERPGRAAGRWGRWLRSRRRPGGGRGAGSGAGARGRSAQRAPRRAGFGLDRSSGVPWWGRRAASGAVARRAWCRSRRGPRLSGPLRQRAGGPGGWRRPRRWSGSARRAFRSWGGPRRCAAAVSRRCPSARRPSAGPESGGPRRVSSGVRP